MNNGDSDMSFDSTTLSMSEYDSDNYGSLSDEEYKEYEQAKKRVIMDKDKIAERVRSTKIDRLHSKPDVVYFDGNPHVLSNGRYIQVLPRFNYTTDFANWTSKQFINNDFDEWLMVPRSRRVPYSPLKLGGTLMFNGESFNYRSLYVENLSMKTSGLQLREIFSRYGYIRDVYIPINHITGEKCNYAFVEIHPFADISQIIEEMTVFSVLNGKSMRVQLAISGRRSANEMRTRYTHQSYSTRYTLTEKKEDASKGRFNVDIYP